MFLSNPGSFSISNSMQLYKIKGEMILRFITRRLRKEKVHYAATTIHDQIILCIHKLSSKKRNTVKGISMFGLSRDTAKKCEITQKFNQEN